MEAINTRFGRRTGRVALSAAVGALLTAGSATVSAEPVSVTVEHSCPLPLIGDATLTSEVSADLPETLEIDEKTGPIDIDVETTIPDNARNALALAQGDTLEGTADADATIALSNEEDRDLGVLLEIPQSDIPSESGSFSVPASGTVDSQSFSEEGDGEISIGDMVLEQQVRDSDGNLLDDPVGEFTADCTLETAAEDAILHTFTVEGGGDPTPDPASIDVEPQELEFGRTMPGDPAEERTQTVTVSNEGDEDLVVNNVDVTGDDAGTFSAQNDCATVSGGESCSVDVTYSPDVSKDSESATLSIASSDEENSPVEVSMTGQPQETPRGNPVVTDEVDFGVLNQEDGSVEETITLSNDGNASMDVTDASLSDGNAGFTVLDNNCTTVAEDESCDVTVQFTPSQDGNFSDSLNFSFSDGEIDNQQVELMAQVETDTPDVIEVAYDAEGSTTVEASDGNVPLTGVIDSDVNPNTGDVKAELELDPTTGHFEIPLLFHSIDGSAEIEFEPQGETTGTLEDGKLTTESELDVHVTKANVNLFGKDVKIGGGTECRTEEPARITLENEGDNFRPLSGGTLKGTYELPRLENCGLLTEALNKFMAGPGNEIELELTPQDQE